MVCLANLVACNNVLPTARELRRHCLQASCETGLYIEAGVYRGRSLSEISAFIYPRKVYGFDSFAGLPEDWELSKELKYDRGHFRLETIPTFTSNVELVIGLYEETIEQWASKQSDNKIAFLHVDCDLYSSTKTVLFGLEKLFTKGTIIVFDEICQFEESVTYENWEKHEWRAFLEWQSWSSFEALPFARTKKSHAAFRLEPKT